MMELRALEAEFRARMHKALACDGVDDYVVVADNPSIRLRTNFTILHWVYFRGKDTGFPISLGKTNRINGGQFYFDRYGRSIQYESWSGGVRNPSIYYNTNTLRKWLFVGVTISEKKGGKLYVNGEAVAEREVYDVGDTTGINLQIGSGNAASPNFPGSIRLVYYYDCVLSEKEIKYIYHNPFDPPRIEYLVLWLVPGSIDLANGKWWDLSGRNNHGTIYRCNEVLLTEPDVVVV